MKVLVCTYARFEIYVRESPANVQDPQKTVWKAMTIVGQKYVHLPYCTTYEQQPMLLQGLGN